MKTAKESSSSGKYSRKFLRMTDRSLLSSVGGNNDFLLMMKNLRGDK